MVKAIIDIDKETNRVLNILKAEYDLKDKSEAIEKLAKEFKSFVQIEPGVREDYLKKLKKIDRQKAIKVGSMKEFRKRYGLR